MNIQKRLPVGHHKRAPPLQGPRDTRQLYPERFAERFFFKQLWMRFQVTGFNPLLIPRQALSLNQTYLTMMSQQATHEPNVGHKADHHPR